MTFRTAGLAAVVCGVLACSDLSAQQPTARPGQRSVGTVPGGTGTVRGVVYDSLLRAPLDSAHVFINGTSLGTMTDAGGRFTIENVPAGPAVIAFEHPDLDSAGLSNNARRIEIQAGRAITIDLTVPSLWTMRRTGCGATQRPARDSGMVYGSVSDVKTGNRLAGAIVRVAWIAAGRGSDGRIQVSRPGIDVRSDSLGNYYICGVPTELVVTATAFAGRYQTGVTELLLGKRGVARRDLAVARDSASLPDSTGLRRGAATVIGTVHDENDRPRPSARASIDDAATDEAFADQNGRFVLRGLPPGSSMLMVRMIGYGAVRVPVLLRDNDTTYVAVHVRTLTMLDTMRITASSLQGQIAVEELQERMRMGVGYFLTTEDVKNKPSMRSVVQGLPQLYIEGPNTYNWQMHTLVSGRPCETTIYIDGIKQQSTEAMQSYRPDQLLAVEWYPRGSSVPLRYQPAENSQCSVLLVWTKFMR